MRIKLLQMLPSDRPEFPFQAGQTIEVEHLTPEMRAWIASGAAELLAESPEAAVVGDSAERAVMPKAKRGR